MNQEATNYAQTQADTFKNSLQYLIEQQNEQKTTDEQLLNTRYQNLLTSINQKTVPVQEQYATDAKSAYINKMLASKDITQSLSQMNLNTSGLGVGEQNKNNISYGSNLSTLQTDRNTSLREIGNEVTNATGDYNADALSLSSDYADKKSSLLQLIESQVSDKYNTEYSNYVSNKQYEDSQKQQQWENDYSNKQLAEQKRQANMNNTNSKVAFDNPVKDAYVDGTSDTYTKVAKSLATFAKSSASIPTLAKNNLAMMKAMIYAQRDSLTQNEINALAEKYGL